uniref:UvrD/REP helicase n=1 Tax=Mimivirus LCMiAC02 TaxID=2506609 RepID=A0A4D5XF57_9VIRU|nr:MAG: UvrD/REP helicase [Mimivirus LCMiAC02]
MITKHKKNITIINDIDLPPASQEQLNVIKYLETNNVIVDSVAGSGKTTTILYVAQHHKNKTILLLTYNKKLKMETRRKVKKLNITNMEVHSYHSFCVKYYKRNCYTDHGIIHILKNNTKRLNIYKYDMIILDEAQDITPIYYKLICKIHKDNNNYDCKLCIVGDKFQSIYAFNKADARFITYASKLFNYNNISFKETKLSTSFRVTNEMAEFINKCMLKTNRIKANKKGAKVRYIICNVFADKYNSNNRHTSNRPYEEIQYYIRKGYKYSDIFVVAPSVKSSKTPTRQLANRLSQEGVPVYVPVSDEESLDQKVLMGKLVFSSIHQIKGLERPVCIVFGFDDTYFKYYKKNCDPYVCPNELYVATTRSKEMLTIFHHRTNGFLPFLNVNNLRNICYFEQDRYKPKHYISDNDPATDIAVTNLIKHMPVDVLNNAMQYIDIKLCEKKGKMIKIPINTKQNDLYESVSEITGIAIPSYYELIKKGNMTIYDMREYYLKPQSNNENIFRTNMFGSKYKDDSDSDSDNNNNNNNNRSNIDIDKIDINNITPSELLYLANNWNAYKNQYIFKLNQIKKYDWLSKENLNKCVKRLEKYISSNAIFEKQYILTEQELRNKRLIGYVDCIDLIDINKSKDKVVNLWEFKCVSELQTEHKLQLALYMYLHLKILNKRSNIKNGYKLGCYLFNILDGEMYSIKSDVTRLTKMVDYLI